jgi:hypothetical protein
LRCGLQQKAIPLLAPIAPDSSRYTPGRLSLTHCS